jgi:hypothetical protein
MAEKQSGICGLKFRYGIVCVLLSLMACRSDSEKARLMLNQAAVLERQHKTDEAQKLLNNVVAKYGYTKEATEANQLLMMLETAKLQTKTNEIRKLTLRTALITFYANCGRYPTNEEGLKALVVNPGLRCWDGPYLETNSLSWIDDFNYKLRGDETEITLKTP